MHSTTTTPRKAGRERPVSDFILAAIAIGGGVAIIIYASGMRRLNTGYMGPGLFPTLIGTLFIVFGATLLIQTMIGKKPTEVETTEPEPGAPADPVDGVPYTLSTESQGRLLVNGITIVLGIVAYIVLVEPVGFILTMFLVLAAIMLVLKEKPWRALVFSAIVTAVLYLSFEKGLLVQLPNGILGF